MATDANVAIAAELMSRFAQRTGLTSDAPSQRYLWTDAFAACNFLGLSDACNDPHLRQQALLTIERVHGDLGQFRQDDVRRGWLHGPHGAASAGHPTRAGLRIGKPLPERGPGEPVDEDLEWQRDGQYFHYLTRWMHALDQLARATGSPHLNLWARELADTAHRAFTYAVPGGARRMHWKMSIDLSRPLVASMGQHDPLDGYITTVALQRSAAAFGATEGPDLKHAAADYAAMLDAGNWATADPLGLGGLLMDAFRVEQLMRHERFDGHDLLNRLLTAALLGLQHYHPPGHAPAQQRLGFRELGLAIGLAAVDTLTHAAGDQEFAGDAAARRLLAALQPHVPVRDAINAFWLAADNRCADSWRSHRDINEVMLATSLVPGGWLLMPAVSPASSGSP
ncbi:MAG TPA: hypothetical protein VK827_01850 [Lysobacter sp.]|nr:hypothetical protein [Lysobacter sp.]